MRIDAFLVWGHGLNFLKNILEDINNDENFNILRVERHKPKSISAFVKKIYSQDYAPYWHLREKTKYLLKTKCEVCFIFVNNLAPDVEYFGQGNFRHRECKRVKNLKEIIRDNYNSICDGKRSNNHIIHATDSPEQADHFMKLLGYNTGIKFFSNTNRFINIPFYIKNYSEFEIKTISTDSLRCSIVSGDSWENYSIINCCVRQTPHFKFLLGNQDIYKRYLEKFLGGPLKQYYNCNYFETMFQNYSYLEYPNDTSFVLTIREGHTYLILDGLHRASMHVAQGNRDIKICQLSK